MRCQAAERGIRILCDYLVVIGFLRKEGSRFCFSGAGSSTCRTVIENGSPAGPITPGTLANTTLASVFCIPATSDGLVNSTVRLPGPGAVSLPGTALVF
jgi:hypothetical protein